MEAARIKKARRHAERRGLILRKSRIDGTWMIIEPVLGAMILGPENANGAGGLTLEAVEDYLYRG